MRKEQNTKFNFMNAQNIHATEFRYPFVFAPKVTMDK